MFERVGPALRLLHELEAVSAHQQRLGHRLATELCAHLGLPAAPTPEPAGETDLESLLRRL